MFYGRRWNQKLGRDLSLSPLACLFSTIIHAMQAPPHNTPTVSIHNDYNFWRNFSSSSLFIQLECGHATCRLLHGFTHSVAAIGLMLIPSMGKKTDIAYCFHSSESSTPGSNSKHSWVQRRKVSRPELFFHSRSQFVIFIHCFQSMFSLSIRLLVSMPGSAWQCAVSHVLAWSFICSNTIRNIVLQTWKKISCSNLCSVDRLQIRIWIFGCAKNSSRMFMIGNSFWAFI